ncbi:MAG: efflux RND transporter periplasmic adaptor subunit [Geminicoccaceae bacterium]|nr:efflux RND transporter periplasmic adaptor subunit [Geminicoccaceae bacterium]
MRRSALLALAIVLLVGAWLASPLVPGLAATDPAAEDGKAPAEAKAPPPTKVRVARFEAAPVEREIALSGRTAPLRTVEVVAETAGRIVELPARKGGPVKAGDVLARLDPRDKAARLKEAEAALKQRRLEETAARRLGAKGFQAETQVAAALAALEQANALVETARLDLDDATVKAPIDGWLDRLPVEAGGYLREGDAVAGIVQLEPLKVVADLPEAHALAVRPGQTADVRLPDGRARAATVAYLGKEADDATRTFRVELALPNPGGRVPAGVSAAVQVHLDEVVAQKVPTALLALDDAGRIGVDAVDEGNRVAFLPVEIVKSGPRSVWVTGLPGDVRLVTVGQGFVAPGQTVEPVMEAADGDGGAVSEAGPVPEGGA